MSQYTVRCKGIVAYSQHGWKMEDLLTREPGEDEFLVDMIATGVCHTDISGYGGIYPRVLGHEGMSSLVTSLSLYIRRMRLPIGEHSGY